MKIIASGWKVFHEARKDHLFHVWKTNVQKLNYMKYKQQKHLGVCVRSYKCYIHKMSRILKKYTDITFKAMLVAISSFYPLTIYRCVRSVRSFRTARDLSASSWWTPISDNTSSSCRPSIPSSVWRDLSVSLKRRADPFERLSKMQQSFTL